jgi:hypothetical protein
VSLYCWACASCFPDSARAHLKKEMNTYAEAHTLRPRPESRTVPRLLRREIGPVEVAHKNIYFTYRNDDKQLLLHRPKQQQAEATKAIIDDRKAVMEKYH